MNRKRAANLFLVVALIGGLYLFRPAEDGIAPALRFARWVAEFF